LRNPERSTVVSLRSDIVCQIIDSWPVFQEKEDIPCVSALHRNNSKDSDWHYDEVGSRLR
jgi:hypothetical protein